MNQNPAMPASAAKLISPHSLMVGTFLGSGAILRAIVQALKKGLPLR